MVENDSSRANYIARINRVVDHIDAHLSESLTLEALAEVAHFSPFHFHRLFSALTGETLADCIRRRRLERAASSLIQNQKTPVLDTALNVGFSSAEVFSRNFRQHFGITPTAWRKGDWKTWATKQKTENFPCDELRGNSPEEIEKWLKRHDESFATHRNMLKAHAMEVALERFPDEHVAYLRHVGPYYSPGVLATWQKLDRWIHVQALDHPPRNRYAIPHDSPGITPASRCRYDASVAIDPGQKVSGEIGTQTIPGGLYACGQFRGSPNAISFSWQWMFAVWLPNSGYQYDARPCFELHPGDIDWAKVTDFLEYRICIPIKTLD